MGSYNTAVITTVGQALLTSVLGSQGTMTFTKLQTSSYAYASGTDLSALTSLNNVEQEANIGTATIVDSTHIAASATISNSGISTEYNVNTLGIFASDGVNEVLFAVSAAVTPDVIPVDSGGTPSTYKYNFTLAVSSTSDITISAVGDITANDVSFDNTTSGLPATEVQTAIDDIDAEVDGIVNVYGSKNLLPNKAVSQTINGVTFTVNADGSITANGTATAQADLLICADLNNEAMVDGETYIMGGLPLNTPSETAYIAYYNTVDPSQLCWGEEVEITKYDRIQRPIQRVSIGIMSGKTVSNFVFKPMIRSALITDDTFVPYAKTNRELTVDKVERADLTDVNIMGTTNTSGRLITTGMHFYLNNQFCRAKVDISANATFTLGTNYVVESAYKDSGWIPATLNTTYFSSGGVWYRTIGEKCYVTFQGCVPIAVADAIIATGLPKADTFFSGCATPESGSPGRAVFIQQNDTVLRTRLVDTETLCGSIEYLMM